MVNNSINIIKVNNRLSPQIIAYKKKKTDIALWIKILTLDRPRYVAGLNQYMDQVVIFFISFHLLVDFLQVVSVMLIAHMFLIYR